MTVGSRSSASSPPLLQSPDHPGPAYDRAPEFADITREVDVMVPMRDGVKICVDIYRPNARGKFPALLAFAIYNKDLQGPDLAEALALQFELVDVFAGQATEVVGRPAEPVGAPQRQRVLEDQRR